MKAGSATTPVEILLWWYLQCVRLAYLFSFAIPLLNPAINNTALYFYVWLPIMDFEFLSQLVSGPCIDRQRAAEIGLLAILFIAAMHSGEMLLRGLIITLQLAYLLFLSVRNLYRFLHATLVAHIAVAVLQVMLFFTPGGVPDWLTPTGMTRAIWGAKFSPATFTNFGFEL